MKPWAVILIILIVLLTLIALCIVYGKRVVHLLSHNLALSQAQADARDEEARVAASAQRLATHVRDLNAIVAAQEKGLDAQARILAQHGVVLPGRVYQVPPREEGGQPQFFRLEPVQVQQPAAEGAQGGGNADGKAAA